MIRIYIPFYSDREKLRQTIESVEAQEDDGWTLTILDDCSQELQEVDSAKEFLGPHQYRRNEQNLGMVGNWNQALQSDEGLASLLHADDLLKPNYVQKMTSAAKSHPQAAAWFCQTEIIDDTGKRIFSFPDYVKKFLFNPQEETSLSGEDAVCQLLRGNFIFCPTMVFNRKQLASICFDPKWKFVQDLDFTLRVLEAGHSIVGLPDVAYQYRRHTQNATVLYTVNLLRFEEENKLYLELADRYEQRGWNRAARLARGRRIIKLNLLYCAVRDIICCRFSPGWAKLKFLTRLFRSESPTSEQAAVK